jgi:hypothetical protein
MEFETFTLFGANYRKGDKYVLTFRKGLEIYNGIYTLISIKQLNNNEDLGLTFDDFAGTSLVIFDCDANTYIVTDNHDVPHCNSNYDVCDPLGLSEWPIISQIERARCLRYSIVVIGIVNK